MSQRLLLLLCLLIAPASLPAQSTPSLSKPTRTATLNATVSDPSGARIASAAVHIAAADGSVTRDLTTDPSGRVSATLPPGAYTFTVTAPGFDPFFKQLTLAANAAPVIDARLLISTGQTVVEVTANPNTLSTDASDNKDAIALSGAQLATLSDDDATFQQQLLAIAGGDGSHPPQVFVDGFSGGQFPPKSAIRAVKINQNPFSAEYDELGFGRIEIDTKPGTGRLHGQLDVFGDPSGLNSQNPYLHAAEPGYYRLHTTANLSGPLNKKNSFFLSADYYDQQQNAITNTQTVASASNSILAVNLATPDPQTTSSYTARLDSQWSKNNTLTARYEYDRAVQTNGGLGASSSSFGGPGGGVSCAGSANSYTLPSEAFNCTTSQHTIQLGNSQILGAHAELDTHFEWIRTGLSQNPLSTAPSVLVNGAVADGGSPSQVDHDNQDHFEFQANGTWDHGIHFLRLGLRERLYREANLSTAGFNGTFTFNSLDAYQASVSPTGAPSATPSSAQFTITTGQDAFKVLTADLAVWAEDEIKLTKSLTGNFGLRFETQTAIPDHFDPSPHISLAWAPGAKDGPTPKDKKPAPVVYRIGSAIFYDRFPISNLLTTVQQGNATTQTTFTVANPPFFARTASDLATDLHNPSYTLTPSETTTYTLAPDFRSEYEIDTGASAEFALGKRGSIAVNYLNIRGVHQGVSVNANAPLPDGSRPFGAAAGNLYQFTSRGEDGGNLAFIHPNLNITDKINFWLFGIVQRYNGDTGGTGTFASNSYNIHQDQGIAPYHRRQALFTGADADLKYGLHLGAFLAYRAGRPFNITTGADNNNDSIFNDRPSFAAPGDNPADVIHTALGNFNIAPTPGEAPIPFDYGRSPAFISLQMQLSETVKFGPRLADPDADPLPPAAPGKPAPLPDPRYALVFSIEAQNVTNTVSPDTRIGVLTSPFFNQSIASANNFVATNAANRTLTLHTTFRF